MADERVPTANLVEDPSDHSKNREHPDWNAEHGWGRTPNEELAKAANFNEIYKTARDGEGERATKKAKAR